MMLSARGMAIHRPVVFAILGRVRMRGARRPKVRRKERLAERRPFERAVKAALVKMLVPQKSKLWVKRVKPWVARV